MSEQEAQLVPKNVRQMQKRSEYKVKLRQKSADFISFENMLDFDSAKVFVRKQKKESNYDFLHIKSSILKVIHGSLVLVAKN